MVTKRQSVQCSSATKAGPQCRKSAIIGAAVCKSHGGGAPQVRRKAAERVAAGKVAKAAAQWGVPRDVDPVGALGELLAGSAGTIDFLAAMVAAEQTAGRLTPDNPWLRAHNEERDRLARLSSSTAGLGLQMLNLGGDPAKVYKIVDATLRRLSVAKRPDEIRDAMRAAFREAAVPEPVELNTPEELAARAKRLRDELRDRMDRRAAADEAERARAAARAGDDDEPPPAAPVALPAPDPEPEPLAPAAVTFPGEPLRTAITAGPAADVVWVVTPDGAASVFPVDAPEESVEALEPDAVIEAPPKPHRQSSVRRHFEDVRRASGYSGPRRF